MVKLFSEKKRIKIAQFLSQVVLDTQLAIGVHKTVWKQ